MKTLKLKFLAATAFMTIAALLAVPKVSQADVMSQKTILKDPKLAQLAGNLRDRSIVCTLSSCTVDTDYDGAMYPVTIKLRNRGDGATEVTVTKMGTDYFGDFLEIEMSKNWLIITGDGPSGDAKFLHVKIGSDKNEFPVQVDNTVGLMSYQGDDQVIDAVEVVECNLGLDNVVAVQ